MAKAVETKERILSAAEDLVLVDGVARLTLEATAAHAGMSKGGVLYHFSSRDALVAAMVQRVVANLAESLDRAGAGAGGPGSFTKAYVVDTLRLAEDDDEDKTCRLGAAMIAAIAAEPDLLAPLRQAFGNWQLQIEHDGVDPIRATVARLAADGLWFAELFGVSFVSPSLRRQVQVELDNMIGQA